MFLIVGGDKRNLLLAKKLSENGEKVKVFGFNRINEDFFANNRIRKIANEKELEEEFEKIKFINKKEEKEENIESEENKILKKNIIVGPIPFSVDSENLYAPFNSEKISINILKGKKFIAGKIPKEFYQETITNENTFPIDIMKNEIFTIANTIPTAEGAIAKAIEETENTLDNANIMVIGYGRVGKMLCYKLKQLNANVYAVDRKEEKVAQAKAYGFNAINLKDIKGNICKMNIVFNTVPFLILSKEKLILMNSEAIIIDLASKPYGTDFESAKKLGIKAQIYSGIPGKIAPDFEAEQIQKFINNINKIQ